MTSFDLPPPELPDELEYLRAPALALVDERREIVGCGQADFRILERALGEQTRGLTKTAAQALRDRHGALLRRWLAVHEASDEPLVVGLRFVALLLEN